MAKRFLNNININDQYTFPSTDGSNGQAIITDGAGNLTFGSAIAASADSAESIHISVKNTSGAQILKGTPVYVTGETGNSGKIEVAPADASDSAKMPALGLLESTLNNNGEGFCVQGGLLEGLATATIDGTATTANDTVYVKPGGGLTMTKPTGTGLIQNIAKIARAHGSNGTLVVSSILRTNDVPNLTTGKIWVGDGNTVESTVVHLDEVNGRMGIGTTSPSQKLQVAGNIYTTASIRIENTGNQLEFGNANVALQRTSNLLELGGYDGIVFKSSNNVLDSQTERMRITSGGNVGIGTTSPAVRLDFGSSVNQAFHLYTSGVDYYGINMTQYDSGPYSTNVISGNGGQIKFRTATGTSTQTTRMTITSSGNVGIGTTSPAEDLHVVGDTRTTRFILTDSGDVGRLTMQIDSNDDTVITTGTTTGTRSLLFLTETAERMRITSAGNVGIGTTSPNYKFVVSNGTQSGTFNPNSAGFMFLGSTSNHPLYFGVNDQTKMVLLSNGNVGIGTTIPGYKLDVNGNIRGTGTSQLGHLNCISTLSFGAFTAGNQGTIFEGYSTHSVVRTDSARLDFYMGKTTTGVGTMMSLTDTGRVGIGTTSPGSKLDVSGDINGTNVYSNKLFTNIEESVANITSYSASSSTIFLPVDAVYPSVDYISVDDFSNAALPIFTVGDQVVIKNSNDSSEVVMQLVYDEYAYSDPYGLYSNATVVSGTLSGDYLYELGYITSTTVINIDTDLTTILSAGNYIILGGIEYLISAITSNSITINANVENIQFINTVGLSTDFAMVSYKSTLSNGIAVQETPVLGFNIQKNKTFLKGSIDFFDSDTNQFIGKDSGASSVSDATSNTTSGYRTLYNNTTGSYNSAFGYEALNFNTTGSQNVALGYQALLSNTIGRDNVAIGHNSSSYNVTGTDNISIGTVSMAVNDSGIRNLAIGTSSLFWNTNGNNNIGLGYQSLNSNRHGSDNVSIGYRAAVNSGTTVNNSVFVGSNTKPQGSNQSNQIVIGYDATGNGSNTVTIGNSLITNNYFNGAVNSNSFKVKALNVAPATSTSAGVTGEIRYTSNYIYVCVATNTWKRTLLSTW